MPVHQPLVSVIIPLYNAAPYVAQTLESVLNQSWTRLEVFVVNDGSKDEGPDIARRFESRQLKVIDQANAGASAARNTGLRLAQGDYVQFLDADDLLSPNKIEAQLELLKDNKNGISSCPWGRFSDDPNQAVFKPESLWEDLNPVEFLIRKYSQHQMMQPGVWLCPRAVIEQAGEWDESLSLNDDGEYFSRVVLAAKQIHFCNAAKVYYRSGNANSLASSKSEVAYQSWFKSLALCAEQLLAIDQSSRSQQALADHLRQFQFDIYPEQPTLIKAANSIINKLAVKPTNRIKGTPLQQKLSPWLGWKNAKRLHNFLKKLRP